MRLLILGGTGFIGPFQVRYALSRGHHVTVFNRGKTHPGELPAGVEQLIGDRNGQPIDNLLDVIWLLVSCLSLAPIAALSIMIGLLSVGLARASADADHTVIDCNMLAPQTASECPLWIKG
jgi:hypothetical protein